MVGEGSAKLDFGHTSEKKKKMFDLIKEEKELKEKREKKRKQQGDFLRGKKKVEKLMSVNEWDAFAVCNKHSLSTLRIKDRLLLRRQELVGSLLLALQLRYASHTHTISTNRLREELLATRI